MSGKSNQSVAASEAESADPSATFDGYFNMSIQSVPTDWVEAQHESPVDPNDATSLHRGARFNTIPTGQQSPFVANLAAIGASFVTGSLWYLSEVLDLYRGPWVAVILGAVIALSVRIAGGAEPSYRAALAAASYLLTLLLVLILITHRELTDIYGGVNEFQAYEQTLVRTRLQDPLHLLAYGLGGFVAAQVSYIHRTKR